MFYARFDKNKQVKKDSCDAMEPPTAITVSKVRNLFKMVNSSKAPGPDKISSKTLKTCCAELCEIFQHIFNESITTGNIPSIWKHPQSPQFPRNHIRLC